MSTYITLQGQITFANEDRREMVERALLRGGWMKDGKIVDEAGSPINDEPAFDGMILTIPISLFRNIGYCLGEFVKGCKMADLVWTSTDGQFQGGVFEGEKETTFDLEEYAKTLGDDLDTPPDPDTQRQEYVDWLAEVEHEFHLDKGP